MTKYVLALDQGTTSSRAIVFNHQGTIVASSQREFPQLLPGPGEVEHDPEAIWDSQLAVARDALARAEATADQIAAIGVANQRETIVLWDRHTGRPVHNAIVWQSRVSSDICQRLKSEGAEETIRAKTGLLIALTLALVVLLVYQLLSGPRSASAASPPTLAPGALGAQVKAQGAAPRLPSSPGPAPARLPLPDLPSRLARDLFEVGYVLWLTLVQYLPLTVLE